MVLGLLSIWFKISKRTGREGDGRDRHCASDTIEINLAGDRIDWDHVLFDLEILCAFVEGCMRRGGDDTI